MDKNFLYPVMFVNIRFMSVLCWEHSFHVRWCAVCVRQHPLEIFVHAKKMKRMITNKNIRWLSCACPVYLLLLFAIHSLDVRGSYVVQSVDGTWAYTPRVNKHLTDKHRIPAGFTSDRANWQQNWKTERKRTERMNTEYLQDNYRRRNRRPAGTDNSRALSIGKKYKQTSSSLLLATVSLKFSSKCSR